MLAHVHIMKTGGQTLCDVLRQSLGAKHCDLRCGNVATVEDLEFAKRFYPQLESIAGHSIRAWSDLAELPELRLFTILREPIARCLSHYQFDRVQNRKSIAFLPWLDERRNYMTRYLAGTEDVDTAIAILEQRVEFVGLLEDFDRTVKLLGAWCQKPLIQSSKSRNVSKRNAVKDEILADAKLVKAMHQMHYLDKRLYDHVQSEIYPRLVRQLEGQITSDSPSVPFARINPWPTLKRNWLYKPAAKFREQFRRAG